MALLMEELFLSRRLKIWGDVNTQSTMGLFHRFLLEIFRWAIRGGFDDEDSTTVGLASRSVHFDTSLDSGRKTGRRELTASDPVCFLHLNETMPAGAWAASPHLLGRCTKFLQASPDERLKAATEYSEGG